MNWPHDDTTSLIAFYGRPWLNPALLTHVTPPFQMRYEGTLIHGILIHMKCADALKEALNKIWYAYDCDQSALDATGFTKYSGSYNYRNVRGGQRLSCHSFGAALDFNAENLPLYSKNRLPELIVKAFKDTGAIYGGDFKSRSDPMHIQWANEG